MQGSRPKWEVGVSPRILRSNVSELFRGGRNYNTQEEGSNGTGTALANTSVFLRIVGQCQAAVAEAVSCFGRIDILFCCACEGTPATSYHSDRSFEDDLSLTCYWKQP